MVETFDRRLHPVRPDLAAAAYEGRITADRFVEGQPFQVDSDLLNIYSAPRADAGIDTQALYGETFTVYEDTGEGWAWGQLETDNYVGWVSSASLARVSPKTHRVRALRTYRYPGPDLRFPPLGLLSMGSRVEVVGSTVTRGLDYALLSDGSAVVAKHLVKLGEVASDWVAVAEEFLGTPYLWAGRTSVGIDCSALVQIAGQAAGLMFPRDSDMQLADAGETIPHDDLPALLRGDLVFWKGHVGIVQGPDRLLHANGYTMTVVSETLSGAVERIGQNEYGAVLRAARLII